MNDDKEAECTFFFIHMSLKILDQLDMQATHVDRQKRRHFKTDE